MSQEPSSTTSWKTILLLVIGVIVVVILALLLAQVDTYQRRSSVPANVPPVTDLEATIAAGDLATIYLPSEVSPTPTVIAASTMQPPTDQQPLDTPAEESETDCNSPPDWQPYTVGPGDTLPKLARAHGTTVYYILKANCLEYVQLMVGTEILLPTIAADNMQHGSINGQPAPWPGNPDKKATQVWPAATP